MIWPFTNPPKEAIELLKELESSDIGVRAKAFHALIEHPDIETDQLILATLEVFEKSNSDFILPLIDIAGKRQILEALPIFKTMISGNQSELRESALQALISIKTQNSLDILISCLHRTSPEVKQKVHNALTKEFGKEALGALIRALPRDHSSDMYFEIVSIMEELSLFNEIKKSFSHPDLKIKEFYFDTIALFSRPDFIPLYLDFYSEASNEKKVRTIKILNDFSLSELIPYIVLKLEKGNTSGMTEICDKLLVPRFNDGKSEILSIISSLPDRQSRRRILPRLLEYADPFCFDQILNLFYDPLSEICGLAQITLSRLVENTFARIEKRDEPNKTILSSMYEAWEEKVYAMLSDHRLSDEQKKYTRRLFFAFAYNRHHIIKPFILSFFQQGFHETYLFLKEWPFEEQLNLLHWLITTDPSFGSLLLSSIPGSSDKNLWRLVLSLISKISDIEDRKIFKESIVARNRNISLENFLTDEYPSVRVAAIELADAYNISGLINLLEVSTKDPDPSVRIAALTYLNKTNFPKMDSYLKEAMGDPNENVALIALEILKTRVRPMQLVPVLIEFINSSHSKLREFALSQIASLTYERYKANFEKLNPETRKLAAQVIQKIDSNFTNQVIQELASINPQTRLKAAQLMENIRSDDKSQTALITAMKDPSKIVRATVVKTLGIIGNIQIVKNLVALLGDPDLRVRANTIEAIGSLGDRQAIQMLLPFLEDSNNRIRANAIVSIRKIGNFNMLPVLQKMLADGNYNMRASAIWAIGEIQDANLIQFVLPFFGDKNELVRFNAIKIVAKTYPQLLAPYLPTFRKDTSDKIRELVRELSYKVL